MSTITYKGFQASVQYEDGNLFIKILHINDLLIATCRDASDVDRTFKELVDDYLAECAEIGKEPEKPFSGTFNVRVDKDVHRRVAMAASDAQISLNAWVSTALAEKLMCGNVETRVDSIFQRRREEVALLRINPFIGRIGSQNPQRGQSAVDEFFRHPPLISVSPSERFVKKLDA